MTGIHMAAAAGGGGIVDPIPITNFGDFALDPADASSVLTFDSDGDGTMAGISSDSFNWFQPTTAGIGAGYWIRLTVNSGTSPTGGSPTATWLQLNSARSWSLTRTTIGTSSGNYTLQIASDSGGANIVSDATITMTSTVEP